MEISANLLPLYKLMTSLLNANAVDVDIPIESAAFMGFVLLYHFEFDLGAPFIRHGVDDVVVMRAQGSVLK